MVINDHSLIIGCEPDFFPYDNPFGPYNGPFSLTKRCLLGENIDKISNDFALDFLRKYKGYGKYARITHMDGHEPTTMVA